MENIHHFSWSQLLALGATLLLLYLALYFIDRILVRANFLGGFKVYFKNAVHAILLIYEPIAFLLLVTVFVLIDLLFHGTLVLLVLIFGFQHIRNYVTGQIIKFDSAFSKGNQIKAGDDQGMISDIGSFGLKIKTNKGIQFIDYSRLVKNGYLILSGEEIGGFYQLKIKPANAEELENFQTHFMDLLSAAPYLDWNHKPEIMPSEDHEQLNVKVIVKEESHLYDLVALIKEWGFLCKITNN